MKMMARGKIGGGGGGLYTRCSPDPDFSFQSEHGLSWWRKPEEEGGIEKKVRRSSSKPSTTSRPNTHLAGSPTAR